MGSEKGRDAGMRIAIVGAGNLATNLGKAMRDAGMEIIQVYSRTKRSAGTLAGTLGCGWTDRIEDIDRTADVYVVSLKDSALQSLAARLVDGRGQALWLHTAGSMPLDTLPAPRRGVLYPMQTFSKNKDVCFREIPVFVEANSEADTVLVEKLAGRLSDSVHRMSSRDRCYLHLAAVFCCNFANHCYAIGEQLLREHGGVPFGVMMPLIEETTRKLHTLSPREGQTGPAVRWDENVIDRHVALLDTEPTAQAIYRMMSKSIHNMAGENPGSTASDSTTKQGT